MKKIKRHSALLLCGFGLTLALASCSSAPSSTTSSETATSSEGGLPVVVDGNAATGSFDYSNLDWQEKTKITAALEKYTMENFTGGIPLYDDSSSEAFSQRITPKSTEYITNYGFGVMEGTMDTSDSAKMYDGSIVESRPAYRNYFHGYTNTDSGTFNGWDATGADVSERNSMITSSYYGVEMNENKDGYHWVGSLARDEYPVMLTPKAGSSTEFEEHVFTGENDPLLDTTSVYWRVYLHVGEGYAYQAVPGSKWENSEYNGRMVKVEDYITPFKAMLDNKLTRASELVAESSGFYKASDYLYDSSASKTWANSGIGIQINEELSNDQYGVIDFHFISPHAAATARTTLSSSLYSPIPSEFLKAIGGAKNFGVRGSSANNTFDNFLCFGAYTPIVWDSGIELVYQKNADYFEASHYSFNGITEKVYSGSSADELAWQDFLDNKLDECTIPVSALAKPESYAKAKYYRTKGSTIIKINLNTCNSTEWNYFFGPNGTVYQHAKGADEYESEKWQGLKEIMSNKDFLRGFYFAIDRESLAKAAGRNPAIAYLSDAYMIDPTGKTSYRSSDAAKSVVKDYVDAANNEYCYSTSLAEHYFRKAGQALVANGWGWQPDGSPETVTIEGFYRYQSTIDNLGNYIKVQVADVFNRACSDLGLKLNIELEVGGNQYTDTYTLMDHGEFDFAEGAISGNVLDPLNFMDTCSSTSSLNQGFNLNWGRPTDYLSSNPAVYGTDKDGNELHWSYDALWSASQGFVVVEDGVTQSLASNQRFVGPGQTDSSSGVKAKESEIVFLMDYPDEAVDEEGDLLYKFGISECGLFPTADGVSSEGGYYFSDYKFVENASGWIELRLDKDKVVEDCQAIANSLNAPVTGITLQFYLVYTVYPGTANANTKTMIISPSTKLESLGMDPVQPNN